MINNTKWKELNIMQQLFDVTQTNPNLKLLDQDVLNIVLKDNWIPIHKRYNYQLAAKIVYMQANLLDELSFVENIEQDCPVILHYTDKAKPWLNTHLSQLVSLRDRYWFYYQLEWKDIIQKHMD